MSSTTFYNSQNLVGIGSVGIGTVSPQGNLHVNAAIGGAAGIIIGPTPAYTTASLQASLAMLNDGMTPGQQNGIQIGKSGLNSLFITYNYTGTASTDYTALTPYNTAVGSSLVVQGSGRVGIGTANPTQKLEVSGYARISGSSDISRLILGPAPSSTNFDYCSLIESISTSATNTASTLKIYTHGAATTGSDPTLAMTINSSQQVGIGTSPTQLLELYSPSASTSHSTLFTGNRVPQVGGGTGKNFLQIQCQDAITPSLGSNITLFTDATGIGPSIEYASLYHNFLNNAGTRIAYIQSPLTGGATTLSIDANGGIIRTTSDQRLKTDIQPISYGLETVNAFRPVSFEWNEPGKYGTGRSIGMIAQEVAQLVPEAVSAGTDEDKTLSLDYQKIVPVLAKAIQELSAKNAALEQSLGSLEARLAALEAK
jgi:hypothetical protein